MVGYKKFGVLSALVLLALTVVAVASAASPSEIYADYADNAKLDRTYSDSDLRNALNDAAVQGYGKPTVTAGLRGEIEDQLGDNAAAGEDTTGSGGVDAVGRTGGTLPFTGVDLALLTAGAGFLLLLGLGFRRLGRVRA